ncbi:MAG: choice-of-anchor D domain-containing protein [Fimbriimonadaceae bacterium]|nr:choice-of-anchor D domain-containing protein [Fimbriimonadaceae bacterium]QYK54730.1 MAG: choice-of-anchor D domain-containing protein [Fimbriimonadaceae bacterium]
MNSAPGSPGDWAFATFVNGPDSDAACFYRTSKVSSVTATVVATGNSSANPRNVMRYDFTLTGYTSQATKIAMYNCHMKAADTPADAERRRLEAVIVRNDAKVLGRPFLVAGDFNVYRSTEPAYVELTGSQVNNNGQFFDPIKTPGTWNNNGAFRFVHTQDPIGAGGMDDRFDQILLSSDLVDGDGFDYLGDPTKPYSTTTWNDPNHSYRAWGNDGTSFNTTLTVTNNTMVGPDIATAIRNAANGAGHIPVLLDLRVPAKVDSTTAIDFGTVMLNRPVGRTFNVRNNGNTNLWGLDGIARLKYTMQASSPFFVNGGQFQAAPGQANDHTLFFVPTEPGLQTGTVTIQSDDPDQPTRVIQVRAFVLAISPGWINNSID